MEYKVSFEFCNYGETTIDELYITSLDLLKSEFPKEVVAYLDKSSIPFLEEIKKELEETGYGEIWHSTKDTKGSCSLEISITEY